MARYLVIVESPTKVKTIRKFLGPSYVVMASAGHVRDLPKSQLGFDPANDYEPKYITIRGKGEILAALRKEVKKADKVFLATDPDREGEAISWHLIAALNPDPKKTYRITFNEITKNAVKEALRHPRQIDMDMVDAQQTRRIVDRMVGYRISPLLWKKIKRGLSAGRVQSVALRIIADREKEINEFVPTEYWSLDAEFEAAGMKKPLTAQFYGVLKDGKAVKTGLNSEEEVSRVLAGLGEQPDCRAVSVKRGERMRKAPLPFTTSTLQQEASRALNFSTQKTMRLAQQLYEGIDLKDEGTVGLITYLRTDSTRISEEADKAARAFIGKTYGENYLGESSGQKKSTGHIQDAHEAIRPSDINRTPDSVKDAMSRDLFRLYQLIWKRFAASRMAPARYETLQIRIQAADSYLFTAGAGRLDFDGYRKVYAEAEEEEKAAGYPVGSLEEGERLTLKKTDPEQHFTQPPAHYTEASLVKTLEELGIGRPSTYAPTITTLLARHYITKEKKNLYITELGDAVNNIMKNSFPEIDNVQFTAYMESMLDSVAEGKTQWKQIVRNFYPDLEREVMEAEQKLDKVSIEDEKTDIICEHCGRNMVIKYGPHGKFLACPGFPECRNTKPYFEKAGVKCPKCGQEIVLRRSKKGRRFYGCENPECDFVSWQKPSDIPCPQCGSYMVERGAKLVCANSSCGFSMAKETQQASSAS